MNAIDITYLGNFKFPTLAGTEKSFAYSDGPACLSESGDTLYLHGHDYSRQFAEVPIPTFDATATITRWFDPTFGQLDVYNQACMQSGVAPNGLKNRGLMFADGAFHGAVNVYYNVSNKWIASLFRGTEAAFSGWGKPSITSFKSTGMIGDLPPRLKDHFGCDTFSFDAGGAGLAGTNNGPALYVLNRQASYPDQQTVPVTMVFESPISNPYDYWWGDRRFSGATFTNTDFVIGYTKTFGARWYGKGNPGWGQTYDERGKGIVNHDIASVINPGTIAVDAISSAQGTHAEIYAPFLLCCSIDSIIAGDPVWIEIDMRPFGLTGNVGRCDPKCHRQSGKLYVLEYRVDAHKPKVHIFQTLSEPDMQELIALRAAVDVLEQAILKTAGENAELQTELNDAITAHDALRVKIDTAILAVDAAKAALE